jgi:hypothetical protein
MDRIYLSLAWGVWDAVAPLFRVEGMLPGATRCGFSWEGKGLRKEIAPFLQTNGGAMDVDYWRTEECWQ